MSAIPFYVWKEVPVERLGQYEIEGISPKPECKVPALVGKITCMVTDEEGSKRASVKIHTYLVLIDEIPLVIGFRGLLEKFKVCFDYETREAYIEVK